MDIVQQTSHSIGAMSVSAIMDKNGIPGTMFSSGGGGNPGRMKIVRRSQSRGGSQRSSRAGSQESLDSNYSCKSVDSNASVSGAVIATPAYQERSNTLPKGLRGSSSGLFSKQGQGGNPGRMKVVNRQAISREGSRAGSQAGSQAGSLNGSISGSKGSLDSDIMHAEKNQEVQGFFSRGKKDKPARPAAPAPAPKGMMMNGGDPNSAGTRKVTVKSSTVVYSSNDSQPSRTKRYSKGWRDPEQDSKVKTRVARVQTQKFNELRQESLSRGLLFEDKDFNAVDTSVYYSQTLPHSFKWMRPHEICNNPRMIVEGASRFDIQQGELGNCWFLASVASLCASGNRGKTNDLLHRVVPQDNSFVENYAGIVHFNIWQYGKWVDVVIDDRLPTMNGRLMFMHSACENEFWSALLEKAYAKLNGSYEAMSGGCSSEAMVDLTGGVVETFDFFNSQKPPPKNIWQIMKKAYDRRSLMACQIDAAPNMIENVQPNGLIVGHAYSMTSVKEIAIRGHQVKLVRIRNPWGNEYEWKGSWSDKSAEWNMVGEAERKELGLSFEDDGEFWMDFDDFKRNFSKLEICNLSPDGLDNTENKVQWHTAYNDGSWKSRVNAGGCRNYLDTFWTNPQYQAEIVDGDDEDDENMGTLIVSLMQKERRKKRREGLDMLTIGFCIYKVADNNGPLDMNFFKYNASAGRSAFSNVREMCQRFRMAPGKYVVIPTTFKPHEEGDFLMRLFTEKEIKCCEVDEETSLIDDDDERAIRDMESKGMVSGGDNPAMQIAEIEARKRRMRSRQVTQDDANQEQQVRALFKNIAGEDLEVDAYELQNILNSQFMREFKFSGFSLETCRSIVSMLDLDKSGKLGYDEFKKLWGELRQWKKIFREFDTDGSGTLNSYELRQSLNSAGMRVSNMTFNAMVMRYADQSGKLEFDEYIHCAVRLKNMFAIYKDMCVDSKPPAMFEVDEFIQTTMYS